MRVIVIVTEEAQIKPLKRNSEVIDALCGSFRNCLSDSDAFAKRNRNHNKYWEGIVEK